MALHIPNSPYSNDDSMADSLQNFRYPGWKICIGVLCAGIIIQMFTRHGALPPAIMWLSNVLILGSCIYTLAQAIRLRRRRIAWRVGLLTVFVAFIMGTSVVLNNHIEAQQIVGVASALTHTAENTSFNSGSTVFYISMGVMLTCILAMLVTSLMAVYYRYIQHDQERSDVWQNRLRRVRICVLGVVAIAIVAIILTL